MTRSSKGSTVSTQAWSSAVVLAGERLAPQVVA